MKVDLTDPQIRLLLAAANYFETIIEEDINDGVRASDGGHTERDLATLDRAKRKLSAALTRNASGAGDE